MVFRIQKEYIWLASIGFLFFLGGWYLYPYTFYFLFLLCVFFFLANIIYMVRIVDNEFIEFSRLFRKKRILDWVQLILVRIRQTLTGFKHIYLGLTVLFIGILGILLVVEDLVMQNLIGILIGLIHGVCNQNKVLGKKYIVMVY